MSSSPLNSLQRRSQEDEFDEETISKEYGKMREIERLDRKMGTSIDDENNKMPKTCLNCESKGYKNMNRHFCSPECATSYYWLNPNNNPYKSKGGKTRKTRSKQTKRRRGRGKSYKKQQKKRSRKL